MLVSETQSTTMATSCDCNGKTEKCDWYGCIRCRDNFTGSKCDRCRYGFSQKGDKCVIGNAKLNDHDKCNSSHNNDYIFRI